MVLKLFNVKKTARVLAGKVAMVTGASSGIGLATCRQFVEQGASVALIARNRDRLEDARKSLNSENTMTLSCDVTEMEELERLPGAVLERFGQIDILVNNAGFNSRGPVASISPQDLQKVITTNLVSPIVLTRYVLPFLSPGGSIVNIASIAGMVPVHREAAYSASKAGLRAFGRVLSMELEEKSIHVANINPGPVSTAFLGDIATVPDIVMSQPMRDADTVAALILDAIINRKTEKAIPAHSGALATLGYLFPSLLKNTRPLLEKLGAKRKQQILRARKS